MKKRQWIIGLFTLTLLAVTVGFSISSARDKESSSPVSPVPASESLDVHRYSAFFHFIVDLQKQASALEGEGKKGDSLREYVKNQAELNDEEARKLYEISAACVEAVSQQDAKALLVIQKFQSQFPGKRVPVGVKLPPPSPELKLLQRGRDQIILAAKKELVSALGESFDRVAKFAETRLSLNMQSDASFKR
jgi:hypothetical protein